MLPSPESGEGLGVRVFHCHFRCCFGQQFPHPFAVLAVVLEGDRFDPAAHISRRGRGNRGLAFGYRAIEIVIMQSAHEFHDVRSVAAKHAQHLPQGQILASLKKDGIDFIEWRAWIGVDADCRQARLRSRTAIR